MNDWLTRDNAIMPADGGSAFPLSARKARTLLDRPSCFVTFCATSRAALLSSFVGISVCAGDDATIDRAMSGIAHDESRHAALAWSIAEWARPRLTDDERRTVDDAMEAAAAELAAELSSRGAHRVARDLSRSVYG